MKKVFLIFTLLLGDVSQAENEGLNPSSQKWEKSIQSFEDHDRLMPPQPKSILFIGSSSIRRWNNLERDFEGIPVINRGFGGSQIVDSIFYANRIIIPYLPQKIFLYAGDNDIATGKKAGEVFHDFREFVKRVHRSLPETEIYFISIKPSISRWHLQSEMRKANQQIRRFVETKSRLGYVDIWSSMLDDDGKPNPDLFVEDGLHLNLAGYEIWRKRIRPIISP